MPMAMIAVALLVTTSFFCAIIKHVEDSTENSRTLEDEYRMLDEGIGFTEMRIEADLGRIISDLSGPSESGNLVSRAQRFDELSENYLRDNYPSFERGVRSEIVSSDIRLTMVSMRLGVETADTSQSTFLRAVGTVDVAFSTETASCTKRLDIRADSSSCLPLSVESATKFELSVEGGNSALAQMVEYQLTSLAQSRVLNGYGMLSEDGNMGTRRIITEQDVAKAVRNALDVIESMCFRDNASGNEAFLYHPEVDLADLIVAENGRIVLDMGAFYAQAILSNIDRYVLQWLDYFGTGFLIDIIDKVSDVVYGVVSSIVSFITGNDMDADIAADYISDCMDDLNAEDLLTLHVDDRYELDFPGMSGTFKSGDEYVEESTLPARFDLPFAEDVHILDWGGWGDFYRTYIDDNNIIREQLSQTLKSVAYGIKDDCKVEVPIDGFDDRTFPEALRDFIDVAIEKGNATLLRHTGNQLNNNVISDPFICAAYQCIRDNKNGIFGVDDFVTQINEFVLNKATYILDMNNIPPMENTDFLYEMIEATNYRGLIDEYIASVDRRVEDLSIMTQVHTDRGGWFTDAISTVLNNILDFLNLEDEVEETMMNLSYDMTQVLFDIPSSGMSELPEASSFELYNDDGDRLVETLDVTDDPRLNIELISPLENGSKNIHYVGLKNWKEAAYSATYTVRIQGEINFTVQSTNRLLSISDLYDSSYTGSPKVDIELDIPCMSGWRLQGTDYKPSNTFFSDVAMALFNHFKPVIDVIVDILSTVNDLERACSTILIEYGNKLSEMMVQIFDAFSVPLTYLQDGIQDCIDRVFGGVVVKEMLIKLGSQSVTLDVFGFLVTISTNLRSLTKNVQDIVTVSVSREISGMCATAACQIKRTGSNNYYPLLHCSAEGEDWGFEATIDPLLNSRSWFIDFNGFVRDTEFQGTIPELVQYKKTQIALSDIPAIGTMLSNIPTPIPGVKCELDAGLYFKHSLPIKSGLLINEVELNPPGNDNGGEWVELFNNTDREIDLEGYVLVPASGDQKSMSISGVTIPAKGKTVIYFDKQALNNSGSKGNPGERITLYDTYGNVVDRTDWITDTLNNDCTNQRTSDGYVDWTLYTGTPGETNNGMIPGGTMVKAAILGYADDAIVEIMDDMGGEIDNTDDLMVFTERVIARIVERFIDVIGDSVIEAYVFVDVSFADYSSTGHGGIRIMLGLDSDIVKDTLSYIASMLPIIGEHINNPDDMCAEMILFEDIYLRTVVYMKITPPGFAREMADGMRVEAGISAKINLSAIANMLGEEKWRWNAEVGIVLEDFPTRSLPDVFEAHDYFDSDLWLIRMTFGAK